MPWKRWWLRPLRLAFSDASTFVREKLLLSGATAVAGLVVAVIADWRLSWGAFDATAWGAGLIGAIGGPVILGVIVFCNYLFRAPRRRPETIAETALRFDGYDVVLVAKNLSAPANFTATKKPLNGPSYWPPEMRSTWLDAEGDSPSIIQDDSRKVSLAHLQMEGAAGEITTGKWFIPMHPAPDHIWGGGFRIAGDGTDQPPRPLDFSVTLIADPPLVGGPIEKRFRLLGHRAFELEGDEEQELVPAQ
jgi:hypothetical protein